MPNVLHLLLSNKLITHFETKYFKFNIFTTYFANHCNLIESSSQTPLTDKRLGSFMISADDTWESIKNLDIDESYKNNDISIKMLKLYPPFICKLFLLIF